MSRIIMMKRVPKKTDYRTQHKVMEYWSSVIIENHSPDVSVPIVSAKEYRAHVIKQNQSYKG